MKKLSLIFCVVPALALALACGSKSVDLDGPHTTRLVPGSDTTTIAIVNEQIVSLAVDDERLYWIGTFYETNPSTGESEEVSALRSCEKLNCAESLVTYSETDVSEFLVHAGQIYWLGFDGTSADTLFACDVTGCAGTPHTLAANVNFALPPAGVTFADGALYFSGTPGLFRFSLASDGGAPTLLWALQGEALAFAVEGNYVYWLEETLSDGISLRRGRTDGSGNIDTLSEHLEIDKLTNAIGLTFDDTHVYWSQGSLSGSIARCPLTGCMAPESPELVVDPVRSPGELQIDGTNMYWQHDTTASNYAISSCSLGSCAAAPALVTGVEFLDLFTIHDAYVYTATTDVSLDPHTGWASPSAHLRRIPK